MAYISEATANNKQQLSAVAKSAEAIHRVRQWLDLISPVYDLRGHLEHVAKNYDNQYRTMKAQIALDLAHAVPEVNDKVQVRSGNGWVINATRVPAAAELDLNGLKTAAYQRTFDPRQHDPQELSQRIEDLIDGATNTLMWSAYIAVYLGISMIEATKMVQECTECSEDTKVDVRLFRIGSDPKEHYTTRLQKAVALVAEISNNATSKPDVPTVNLAPVAVPVVSVQTEPAGAVPVTLPINAQVTMTYPAGTKQPPVQPPASVVQPVQQGGMKFSKRKL